MSEIIAIILAAGVGKRMQSALPKVLHPLCGKPMIAYCLEAARVSRSKQIFVVTGKTKRDWVAEYVKQFSKAKAVYQVSPLGTGHAVQSCASLLKSFHKTVLILCGDTPLVQKETLEKFLSAFSQNKATLGLITTSVPDATGYGRIVRNAKGGILRVVEEKEASDEEKRIREINTGIYAVQSDWLLAVLKKLRPHPVTQEFYLTDIVEKAYETGEKIVGFRHSAMEEFLGVNTRKQLGVAEEILRDRLIEHWMSQGVTFVDPRHVYLDADVTIGRDTVIHPQVHLRRKTRIGKNCIVDCGSVLQNMIVGEGVHIKPYCVLEGSIIEKEAQVGPFARLRPGSHVGREARVGNFVELKKTRLGAKAKVNHLTYLGDADIGDETNVGCGTITCNYDGAKKHPTKIGKRVFVGSDVQFIAPVKIGNGAYIAAGSTITEDVPARALAIARQRQVVKKGWAKKK